MADGPAWTSDPAIDREYNPYLAIANARAGMASIRTRGAAAASAAGRLAGLSYGDASDEYLDLYLPDAGGPAPVHLFIHGGYWCTFDAADHAFIGAALRGQGLLCAVVNYSLCPDTTIGNIVDQCRRALQWLAGNAAKYGGDPGRITVSGHSAGGHLAAMLAAEGGPAGPAIDAIVPVSGVFDIGPMARSWLQPILSIDEALARDNSPVRLRPAGVPAVVVVGAEETPAFARQSRDYAEMLSAHQVPAELLVLQQANHLSILDDFESDGRLARLIGDVAHGRRTIGAAAAVE